MKTRNRLSAFTELHEIFPTKGLFSIVLAPVLCSTKTSENFQKFQHVFSRVLKNKVSTFLCPFGVKTNSAVKAICY